MLQEIGSSYPIQTCFLNEDTKEKLKQPFNPCNRIPVQDKVSNFREGLELEKKVTRQVTFSVLTFIEQELLWLFYIKQQKVAYCACQLGSPRSKKSTLIAPVR